jgi:uncharacterized protein (TIGR03083 family)
MQSDSPYAEAYRYLRSIIDPLDEAQLAVTCPHCPEWSIRDVLSHLMLVIDPAPDLLPPENYDESVFASLVNADPEEQARAAVVRDSYWNDAVAAVRSLPMPDLLERWERSIEVLDPTNRPPHGDFAVHLGDLDEALGHSGAQELEVQAMGLKGYAFMANGQLEVNGRATVSVIGTSPDAKGGDRDSEHVVSGSTYELVRALTGRRTIAESEELLDWGTTPDDTKAMFPVYDWLDDSRRHQQVI